MCSGDSGIEGGSDRKFVSIGYIKDISGIKGDIKVMPLSDIPGRFASLEKVYVRKISGETREHVIKSVREVKKGFIVSFNPSLLISEAEEMVRGYLEVPEDEVPELSKHSYYHFEIIGMDVLTDDGRCLGKIVDIISTGSNDVYIARDGEKEYMIPAIHEVVKDVDTKAMRMVISVMEGMI